MDGLLTVDGQARFLIADTDNLRGTTPPRSSIQFVGQFTTQLAAATGTGIVIGERCPPAGGLGCHGAADGEFQLQFDPARPDADVWGELRVNAAGVPTIFRLELIHWRFAYAMPASIDAVRGLWQEVLAEFGGGEATVLRIDADGRLFFQSAATGCAGNGRLTAHGNGTFNVYDVALSVENCTATYSHLTGAFDGLATTGPTDPWSYDSALRGWLVKSDGSSPDVSITTWAEYIY